MRYPDPSDYATFYDPELYHAQFERTEHDGDRERDERRDREETLKEVEQ